MAKDLVASKQTMYENNMIALLGESKGAKLATICEAERNVEGEKTTFYRRKASTTKTSVNGYAATTNETSGELVKLEVTPVPKYSDLNLTYVELKNTKLDLKSNFMTSMVDVLNREEDLVVITAIDANGNISTGGDALEYISSDANIDTLIEKIAYSKALAKGNAEHGMDVAVAMSREDYAKLFTANKFTNQDFKEKLKMDNDGYTLVGGTLVPVEGITPGEVYVIPQGTVCFASFGDGDKALMEDLPAKDEVYVMARKTFGASVFDLEAPYIHKLTFKDPTT